MYEIIVSDILIHHFRADKDGFDDFVFFWDDLMYKPKQKKILKLIFFRGELLICEWIKIYSQKRVI